MASAHRRPRARGKAPKPPHTCAPPPWVTGAWLCKCGIAWGGVQLDGSRQSLRDLMKAHIARSA